MEYIMKKIIIILTTLSLTVLWGQKETPVSGNENEETASERVNGYQATSIDPEKIQEIRAVKATMEKIHIKKLMMSATPSGPKSFKVSNSESRFASVKEIIEQIKKEGAKQKISSKKILNKSTAVNKTGTSANNIFDVDKGSSRN